MMKRAENWTPGVSNQIDPAKLKTQAGSFLPAAVNVDIAKGGSLTSRIGYEKTFDSGAEELDSMHAIGDTLVFRSRIAGVSAQLAYMVPDSGENGSFFDIAWGATVSAAENNGELFVSVSDGQSTRIKNRGARQWGVNTVLSTPTATRESGAMPAGSYRYAMTFVNQYGEEGGTTAIEQIDLVEGSSITFAAFEEPPAGHLIRLYVTPVNASELYLQSEFTWVDSSTSIFLNFVKIDDITLETAFHREPPIADIVRAYNGILLMAAGSTVWKTEPFRPHLVDKTTGFFQFPSEVLIMEPVDAGVYVITANKTFFLSSPDTVDAALKQIFDIGGINGSSVRVGEDKVAWLTKYGQAIADNLGNVTLPQKDIYSPPVFASCSSGVVSHQGNEIIVSVPQDEIIRGGALKRETAFRPNSETIPSIPGLGASDFFIDEVISA